MRCTSTVPPASKRHNSTRVAWAENRQKFTPAPSHVAPRGCGEPAWIWSAPIIMGNLIGSACRDSSFGREQMSDQRLEAAENPQQFRDAPRLRDAASRGVWRFGVENFADRTDARFTQMRLERLQECTRF